MDEQKIWYRRIETNRGAGLFWGLSLVAIGSIWLLGSLEIVPEPAKNCLPRPRHLVGNNHTVHTMQSLIIQTGGVGMNSNSTPSNIPKLER